MAKGHKPRAGSRAYWPKKRAARIYPRIRSAPKTKEAIPLAFAAYKAGMTHVTYTDTKEGSPTQGQDISKAVTIFDCPSLVVYGFTTYRKTPYGFKCTGLVISEKPSKDLERKTKLPKTSSKIEKDLENISDIRLLVHTKPREALGKKKPEIFEVPIGGEKEEKLEYAKSKLGQEIKITDVFKLGEFIDASGISKGKGFQGPVKRFGVKIRGRKHTKKRRHIGVLSARNIARVLPNSVAYAGQLGFQRRTEYNKRILKVGEKGEDVNPKGGFINYGLVKNYLIIEGSVPGPRKRLIILRKGMRAKKEQPVELKKISLESQQ
ncbi:MAG: 50S ribosomal protein L3 [Candidatus Aenigmarchaeota archaeon]|nr:50S ribosomal protein L3 [Candidatus Aenigmarchaeota archaeon]